MPVVKGKRITKMTVIKGKVDMDKIREVMPSSTMEGVYCIGPMKNNIGDCEIFGQSNCGCRDTTESQDVSTCYRVGQ